MIPPVAPGQLTCPRGCPIPNTICALLEGRPTCICGPGYFEVPGSGFGSRGSCQRKLLIWLYTTANRIYDLTNRFHVSFVFVTYFNFFSARTIVQPRPAAECSNRCPANSGCSFYGDRLVCICNPGYIVYKRKSCIGELCLVNNFSFYDLLVFVTKYFKLLCFFVSAWSFVTKTNMRLHFHKRLNFLYHHINQNSTNSKWRQVFAREPFIDFKNEINFLQLTITQIWKYSHT